MFGHRVLSRAEWAESSHLPFIYCYVIYLCPQFLRLYSVTDEWLIIKQRRKWCWQGKAEVLAVKRVPVPLCLSLVPHGLALNQSWTSCVGGWRQTAWPVVWPRISLISVLISSLLLRLDLPSFLFHHTFISKLYVHFFSSQLATCPSYLSLLVVNHWIDSIVNISTIKFVMEMGVTFRNVKSLLIAS